MPRIEATEIGPGHYAPILTVELQLAGGSFKGPAMIDTGADTTVFPIEVLEVTGVRFEELDPLPKKSQGAGGPFEVRPFEGRLLWRDVLFCERFLVAEPLALPDWGLLGRDDFLRTFGVKFNWNRNPPWVQIDFPAAPPGEQPPTPSGGRRRRGRR